MWLTVSLLYVCPAPSDLYPFELRSWKFPAGGGKAYDTTLLSRWLEAELSAEDVSQLAA